MKTSEPLPMGRPEAANAPTLEEVLARLKPKPWSETSPETRAEWQGYEDDCQQAWESAHREPAAG